MADNHFEHPRLAAIYDALDPDRSDLQAYAAIAAELGAHRVLDVGCGTGTFARLLAGRRGWREWTCAATYDRTDIDGVGPVESWVQLTDVSLPLVSFRGTYVFAADGQVLTADSTLRFRERDEVETALVAHGYVIDGVREAPDRPGREFVFLARRAD